MEAATRTQGEHGVYVGTYHKYNCGNLNGQWLYLDDYADYEEFIEEAKALHHDEHDPELMFQDFDTEAPESFYSESHIDEAFWDWMQLDEDDRNLVAEYCDVYGDNFDSDTLDKAQESLAIRGDEAPWRLAEAWAHDVGMVNSEMGQLEQYIDWERVANDWFDVTYSAGTYYLWNK